MFEAASRVIRAVAGMDRAMRSRSALANRVREARNADDAYQWIGLADSKLQSVSSLLQRARELTISAGTPLSKTARHAIADELTSFRDEVLGLANDNGQGCGLSDIEDIDLAESVMDLQLQEVSYQAALQASSRALSPSLVDFLR